MVEVTQHFPGILFKLKLVCIKCVVVICTSKREGKEKAEEKIVCHHQDSNQGPLL